MKKKAVGIFVLLVVLVMGGFFIYHIHQSTTSPLSIDDVNSIIESKGIDKVTWEDFNRYPHQDIGSGNYIYQYELSNGLCLYLSGPDLNIPPTYIYMIDQYGNRNDLKE